MIKRWLFSVQLKQNYLGIRNSFATHLPGTIEALEDKVNNKSIRKMCEIYLKSIIKISERRKRRHSGVLIVNFGYLFLMFF